MFIGKEKARKLFLIEKPDYKSSYEIDVFTPVRKYFYPQYFNNKNKFHYHNSLDRVRELVRIRDKRTCQSCGLKWKNGMRKLDVHHIDESIRGYKMKGIVNYDRKNMDKLITYCHKCHMELHRIERIYKNIA